MKEKLIKYWERKERQMKQSPEFKATFLSQAFGALEFAMETMNNWDDEFELIKLWNDEWKPRLEAIVYEM
jgi:hypothetical protein